MNRDAFLAYVKSYIESDPEAAAYVAHSVQAGLGGLFANDAGRYLEATNVRPAES